MADGESKKILILDDDPHLLSYMEEVLRLEHFDVTGFQNPVEGLEHLKTNPVELIITDVKMNEMTGDEVLNHVLKNHPGVGVILVTGFGSIAHHCECNEKRCFRLHDKALQW